MKAFRRSVLLLSAFVLAACSTPDSLASDPSLSPQFGTRGFDQVTDVAYGKALTLYAVGSWDSLRYGEGVLSQPQDAFVRRYDRSGNLLWENYLDIEPAYESLNRRYNPILSARAVAVDGSGNALVAWSGKYAQRVYNEFGDSYYEVAAAFDYLAKYGPSGNKLWRVYTSGALTDLATDSSGNIYATSGSALVKYTSAGIQSWSRSQPQTPTGVAVSSSNNVYIVRRDGVVLKYNASGTQVYLKTGQLDGLVATDGFPSPRQDPYRIVAGLSDELYITSARRLSGGSACDEGFFYATFGLRVHKLSSTGTRQWVKDVTTLTKGAGSTCDSEFPITYLDGLGVAADTNGNVYVAGGQNGSSAYDQNGFVAKYSRAGALAWKKGFGTPQDDAATSVATSDGSEVFIGGITEGFLVHRQLGNGDAVLREVNSSGTLSWAR